MVRQEIHGDLFAPFAAAPERAIGVCVQLSRGRGDGFFLLCRMAASDLTELLGLRAGGDISGPARHIEVKARPHGSGFDIVVGFTRPKLGPPLARPVSDEDGDWILGPVRLPSMDSEKTALLDDYQRQGLLPLTWGEVRAVARPGEIRLPDLLSLRAVVGDGGAILLPGSQVARRRAARAARTADVRSVQPPEAPSLPLAPPTKSTPTKSPPNRSARTRRHRSAVRLSLGRDGRLGLTVPPGEMDSLWMGRPDASHRCCHVAASGKDVLLLPDGDPLADHLGALPVFLRRDGPNWYGRTVLRETSGGRLAALLSRREAGRGGALKSGRDFSVETQPGRLVLREVLPDQAAPPPRPAAADKLARARQMMTQALALVRDARTADGAIGTPMIEILDSCGTLLLSLPSEASEARIRIEIA